MKDITWYVKIHINHFSKILIILANCILLDNFVVTEVSLFVTKFK
uniref:Uncharacterized protein n=1 Tax=Anguilla anguilla TaxID=7936 RepID=A0A0E9Q9W2_ANGAN